MSKQNRTNLKSVIDGFSDISTANKNNSGKSSQRGFSGVASSNSHNGSNNNSYNNKSSSGK